MVIGGIIALLIELGFDLSVDPGLDECANVDAHRLEHVNLRPEALDVISVRLVSALSHDEHGAKGGVGGHVRMDLLLLVQHTCLHRLEKRDEIPLGLDIVPILAHLELGPEGLGALTEYNGEHFGLVVLVVFGPHDKLFDLVVQNHLFDVSETFDVVRFVRPALGEVELLERFHGAD